MFRRRALQVKLVPVDENNNNRTCVHQFDIEQISEVVQKIVVPTAITVGAVYGANRILTTACKITETVVKAKLR